MLVNWTFSKAKWQLTYLYNFLAKRPNYKRKWKTHYVESFSVQISQNAIGNTYNILPFCPCYAFKLGLIIIKKI